MDRRDELEFGGSGCLWALLTDWLPCLVLVVLAAGLTLAGLPGDWVVLAAFVFGALWVAVRRGRRDRNP